MFTTEEAATNLASVLSISEVEFKTLVATMTTEHQFISTMLSWLPQLLLKHRNDSGKVLACALEKSTILINYHPSSRRF